MTARIKDRAAEIARLTGALYPGAGEGRTRALRRVLGTLSDAQLGTAAEAAEIGLGSHRRSAVIDLIEARDLLSLEATVRWGKVLRVGDLEARLREYFGAADAYGPTFAAHVEAWATYHDSCGSSEHYDRGLDYELFEDGTVVPQAGHYTEYVDDYDLLDAVEAYPEAVAALVRTAVERRGIDEELAREVARGDVPALVAGML